MSKVAVVGLGKMGLSHHAILNAHPEVDVVGICDSASYVLGVLKKYTGVATYGDFDTMLSEADLDAVVIATPSRLHARMVRAALERGLHVFCEKPFTLSSQDSQELLELSRERSVVTQVGYHNRFVGAFAEVKRLLDAGAIGTVTHVLGEAYGPVVLKPAGRTWRTQRKEGGGCLYDYAAHVIDLIGWYLGEPEEVGGTALNRVFSREIEDEVCGTLYYPGGQTAQVSSNWSDESQRKMTTSITLWGTAGRIYADRQECQVYLRETPTELPGYESGWNVRYTTELTDSVGFYLRGEEYSAQIDSFVRRMKEGRVDGINGFESAALTDKIITMMIKDAARGAATVEQTPGEAPVRRSKAGRFASWRQLRSLGGS
jgi:predicted dehydrogenase